MSRKFFLVTTLTLWSLGAWILQAPAQAQTPLTRAVIQALQNRVRLMPANQSARDAQLNDPMVPGDALATARAALAELRFNDGSLARIGEQALFRFVPNTRSFFLSNGTALLLIPPGQGNSRVRTPNAAAGIRGSALFVRYDGETETTVIGALTNNPKGPMVITNQDGSQSQDLQAGQLVVLVRDRIVGLYEFDLNTFYETSSLVKGLDLPRQQANASSDPAIAAVQIETSEALKAQKPLVGNTVVENPSFLPLTRTNPDSLLNRSSSSSSDIDPLIRVGFGANDAGVVSRTNPYRDPVEARRPQLSIPGQTTNAAQSINGRPIPPAGFTPRIDTSPAQGIQTPVSQPTPPSGIPVDPGSARGEVGGQTIPPINTNPTPVQIPGSSPTPGGNPVDPGSPQGSTPPPIAVPGTTPGVSTTPVTTTPVTTAPVTTPPITTTPVTTTPVSTTPVTTTPVTTSPTTSGTSPTTTTGASSPGTPPPISTPPSSSSLTPTVAP